MIPLSLFNPWVILGLVAALAAVGGGGYVAGHREGVDDGAKPYIAADLRRAWESQRNTERVRESEASLQEKADAERKANATRLAELDARNKRLADELSKRPDRPSEQAGTTAAPRSGAQGSTGLGLYRSDGLFLVGEAATARRIQVQRDSCYRQYEAAQAEIARLSAARFE